MLTILFLSALFWFACFYHNRNGSVIPNVGGGCFSKSAPTINVPKPERVPTAEEIFQQAFNFNQEKFPLSLNAREEALGILSDPTQTQEFYSSFQPTSFEEALSNQYFQNVIPDIEKSIKHNLSLSGIESSPILSRQIAEARGDLGVDIGQYLSDLGNARAASSLSSRLALDPNAVLSPFVQTGVNQGNAQAQINNDYNMMKAQADYQNALNSQSASGSFGSTIGTLLGGGAGFLLGGPSGAALGAGLGGQAGNLFAGGGGNPLDLGTTLLASQYLNPSTASGNPFQMALQGYGRDTPQGTYNAGSMSLLPVYRGIN